MFISIPSQSTINQYKQLRQSKQEINVRETPKKLDDYVYDKDTHYRNMKSSTGLLLLNTLLFFVTKKLQPKNFAEAAFMVMVLDGIMLDSMYSDYKNKNRIMNTPDDKWRLYKRNGINAVV